ncbi:hypothetical protein LOK49_LG01G00201 [Camellia lanceoleosa]|uniref:Uncharacterized protein n=1 Tax=Camellia lanceoleosa TaxID=1840588 RepID=A0ACC0J544_9ERIC|nr:hypothetical protein LOK49_LG01G00201 [Camellia lanceoleosa]
MPGIAASTAVSTRSNASASVSISTAGLKEEIADEDRQQTLAIRWILEAAFKRRISHRISLEKCSFAEIPDAYRKRELHVRKGRIFMDWLPPIEFHRFRMVVK